MDGPADRISELSFMPALPGTKASIPTPPTCHFDKLPVELISWIAFWVVSDRSGSYQIPPPSAEQHRNFASLARSWRNAVLETPYLWTSINGFRMMNRRLQLSKTMPLDIYVGIGDGCYTRADARTLSLHRDRWRSLHFEPLSTSASPIIPYLNEETPSLRHLSFNSRPHRLTVDLTSIKTPNLQSLRVVCQNVHMPAKVLSNLQVLHFAAAGYRYSVLGQMLPECVSLTNLKLEQIKGSLNDMPNQNVVFNPIILPFLTHLEIIECSNFIVNRLLPSINAPAIQSFTFLGDLECSQRDPEDVLDEATFSGLTALLRENHPWTRLMVEARVGYLHIKVPDVLDYKMPYEPGAVCHALVAAIPVFQLDDTDVALQISMESVEPHASYEAWGIAMRKIQLISLTSSVRDIDNVQWLCDFLTRPPSTCPNLGGLTILLEESYYDGGASTPDAERAIRDMLRHRPETVVELEDLEHIDGETSKKVGGDGQSVRGGG